MEKVTIDLKKIKKAITDNLEGNSKELALSLYNELIFIKDVLDKLKDEINSEGVTEHFINGKQDFIRESQALKSYNTTIKSYQKVITELSNMLPKEEYNEDGEFAL